MDISFSLDEYTASEADEQMIITVCKNKQISGYLSVRVIAAPLMIDSNNFNNDSLSISATDPDTRMAASS